MEIGERFIVRRTKKDFVITRRVPLAKRINAIFCNSALPEEGRDPQTLSRYFKTTHEASSMVIMPNAVGQ